MSVNFRLSAILMLGQRNVFCRKRIQKFKKETAMEETVDINILITPRNGVRKIMQPIRRTSGPATRMRKWNQFNQFR